MELLAPAGSISALKAAVNGGADAVYLGLGEHNARIKSADFNEYNLREWVEYCHLFSVKVHVTLNTAVKDEEIERALTLAKVAVESGADALIVSDLGLLSLLKERTDVPLHLSTQAGVQNYLDARFAASLGVRRVILARETLPTDIPAIKKEVGEVESFIQGALCVCFSGGCLLGSVTYGQSGNRGVCNQACRLKYSAYDEEGRFLKEGYLLSPYDLNLGEDVRALVALGVDSGKIEGRLKRPVYVKSATEYYRSILAGEPSEEKLYALKTAFNRGFTKGYTLRKSDGIINTKVPAHVGVSVGKVEKITEKSGYKYAYVRSEYPFRKGDGAKILRNGIEVGGSDVTSVTYEGGCAVIPVSADVRAGDEVRLTTDITQVTLAENVENKIPVTIKLAGAVGSPLTMTFSASNATITVTSESALEKSDSASANDKIIEKVGKVGNTDFRLERVESELEGNVFLPISEVNALRREGTLKLRAAVIAENTRNYSFREMPLPGAGGSSAKTAGKTIVEVAGVEDVIASASYADAIVINADKCDKNNIEVIVDHAKERAFYLRLPKIAREADLLYIRGLLEAFPALGIYADNLYAVELAREAKRGYIAGFGLNIWNRHTATVFSDADFVCASIEYPFVGDTSFAAGKIPLMSFAHCPVSVAYGRKCDDCDRKVSALIYKAGDKTYRIRRTEWRDCQFTMYADRIVKEPLETARNGYYSFVCLDETEKADILRSLKEAKHV